MLGKGYKSHLSGFDKEKDCNVGGTGCIIRSNNKYIIQPEPKHPDLFEINNQGRVGLYVLEVCPNTHMLVYVVYGWTDADKNEEAASRTDELLSLIVADMDMQGFGPKMIVGDLNGSLPTFTNFYETIVSSGLTDIGSIASAFAGINDDTTCKAKPEAKATRS